MDADQLSITLFLRTYPGQWVSGRIIARRAGLKRRYEREPCWAVPVLARMVEKGILEADAQDHFRLRKLTTERPKRTWISPQVKTILERSSKDFTNVYEIDDESLDEI